MAPPIDGGNLRRTGKEGKLMKKRSLLGRVAQLAGVAMVAALAGLSQAAAKEKISYAYLADPALEGILYGIKSGKVTSELIEIEASALQIPALISSTPAKKYDVIMNAVMAIPFALAPVKAAVLPLIKKDGLPEKAREVLAQLQLQHNVQYDEKDAIGRRYRRQDAIGTPLCITVDHDTLEDHAVTVRNRDTMQQERIPIAELNAYVDGLVSMASLFSA